MFLWKRTFGIVNGDVSESIFIRSAFSLFIIFLVCVVIQAIYAFTILDRRNRANLPRFPFIIIISTSLTLMVVYILQIVSFSLFYDASVTQGPNSISPGPGVVVIIIQFFQRLADFFILSSLLSILDYRRILFKRDTLFTLFKTHKKRIFDIVTMSLMLLAIVAITILAVRSIETVQRRSSALTKSQTPAVDALSTLKGLEDAYVIIYIVVSLNVVITTLYQWMQIIKVDSFRDETVLVLLRFASPVVILRAGFEISIAIAQSFRAPFDPDVFVFVATLVDGISYVTITVAVLCLDGKMAEGNRRLPEVLSI